MMKEILSKGGNIDFKRMFSFMQTAKRLRVSKIQSVNRKKVKRIIIGKYSILKE